MKKFLLLLAISALAYIRPLGGQTVTIGGTALRKVTQNLAPTLTDGANSVPSATAVKNFGSTTLWGKTLPMTVANGDGFRYNANTQAWEAVPYGTATLVGDVTGSIGANTVTALRGKPLPTNPANGDGLRYNSTTQAWEAVPYGAGSLEGDVTGSIVANTVEAIQNQPISATPPNTGQVLAFNGSTWTPTTIATGGGSGGNLNGENSTDPAANNVTNSYLNAKFGVGNFGASLMSANFHVHGSTSTSWMRISNDAPNSLAFAGGIELYRGKNTQIMGALRKLSGSDDLYLTNFAPTGSLRLQSNGMDALQLDEEGIARFKHYVKLEEIDTVKAQPNYYLTRNKTTGSIEERNADLDIKQWRAYTASRQLQPDDNYLLFDCAGAVSATMTITLPLPRELTAPNVSGDTIGGTFDGKELWLKFINVDNANGGTDIRLRTHVSGNVNTNGNGTTVPTKVFFWDASSLLSNQAIATTSGPLSPNLGFSTINAHILRTIPNNSTYHFKLRKIQGTWFWLNLL